MATLGTTWRPLPGEAVAGGLDISPTLPFDIDVAALQAAASLGSPEPCVRCFGLGQLSHLAWQPAVMGGCDNAMASNAGRASVMNKSWGRVRITITISEEIGTVHVTGQVDDIVHSFLLRFGWVVWSRKGNDRTTPASPINDIVIVGCERLPRFDTTP